MAKVYLSLGSNLGDRNANLASAREMLAIKTTLIAQSSVIITKPMYVTEQPEFANQALIIETDLTPLTVLDIIRNIENELGRVRHLPYGPRTIDIDILYYGQEILNLPDLIIPHPLISERAFVLEPLTEIAPTYRCPKGNLSIEEMLHNLLKS